MSGQISGAHIAYAQPTLTSAEKDGCQLKPTLVLAFLVSDSVQLHTGLHSPDGIIYLPLIRSHCIQVQNPCLDFSRTPIGAICIVLLDREHQAGADNGHVTRDLPISDLEHVNALEHRKPFTKGISAPCYRMRPSGIRSRNAHHRPHFKNDIRQARNELSLLLKLRGGRQNCLRCGLLAHQRRLPRGDPDRNQNGSDTSHRLHPGRGIRRAPRHCKESSTDKHPHRWAKHKKYDHPWSEADRYGLQNGLSVQHGHPLAITKRGRMPAGSTQVQRNTT